MIFVAVALLSFACMGILHKLGDRWQGNPILVAVFTMAFSCLITSFLALYRAGFRLDAPPSKVVLVAIPFGICAASALWFFQAGLRHGHIATSWLLINLSSAIPTILSILVYREPLSARRAAIFALVIVSMLLLWWDRKRQSGAPPA